jgi:hypothetical protein
VYNSCKFLDFRAAFPKYSILKVSEILRKAYTLKKIGTLPNLCPGEEPLRFRADLPNLKRFCSKSAECFLGSADPYETLKVLHPGTGSVKHLFFLECSWRS